MTSSISIIPLLIAFGGFVISVFCTLVGWYLWYEGRDLRSSGLTVTATVLTKFRREDPGLLGELENYYARCMFLDAAGLPQEVDVSMQSRRWIQLSEGTTTRLTYVPEELDDTQPGSRRSWLLRSALGLAMMGGGLLAITVCVISGLQEWLTINQSIY
ncbi:hypothetical protein GCM10027341_39180 [Spirosoma knui]